MLGKRNWVAVAGEGSPPRRLGAEQGNRRYLLRKNAMNIFLIISQNRNSQ